MTGRHVLELCLFLAFVAGAARVAGGEYPPLTVEISDQHPLFIFSCSEGTGATPESYASTAVRQWETLDEALRPYAVLRVWSRAPRAARTAWYELVAPLLQQAGVPVVIAVGEDDPRTWMAAADVERLLLANTGIRGVEAAELRFDTYDPPLPGDDGGSPKVRWLAGLIDTAAQYGRFTHLPFGGLDWPRALANTDTAPLYRRLAQCRNHVIPSGLYRGDHAHARNGALLGLWLEGAAAQWGVTADDRWYHEAGYVEPGVYGVSDTPPPAPPGVYRAMVLTGAMAGASVFAFDNPDSLWNGSDRRQWSEAIQPTLTALLRLGLVPRQDFVRKRTPVAFQLAPASIPPEFRANLRDIDAVLDEGLLPRGAYGMERPGQVWELVPNRGDFYLVPLLSPHATAEALGAFQRVVHPGEMDSAADWETLLGRYRDLTQAGDGTAFITTVGRGAFVLNTRENTRESQTFALPALPAPVRGVEARRQGPSVMLNWPFREGDVSYSVYRRTTASPRFQLIASGLEERRYVDEGIFPSAGAAPVLDPIEEPAPAEGRPIALESALPEEVAPATSVAYAVTALTSEEEPYSGTVGYGEYLALSVVESRIEEQVVLHPLLASAVSEPIPENAPAEAGRLDPRYRDVPADQLDAARAIVARIEQWDRAFTAEDLDGVMDLYAASYEDPQGWRGQYVRRAWQWFFERYGFPRLAWQVRRWEFSRTADTGEVNLLLYCRFTGTAVSSADGRVADPRAAIPRTRTGEVWVTWALEEGLWRIVRTNPGLPNFRDLLSYAAGPYDSFPLGADWLE